MLDVLYIRPGGNGWGPVEDLARLAARMLGGRLVEVEDTGHASVLQRASVLLPRGRRARGRRLLVIAGNPAALALASRLSLWTPGYESTAAWVIDSFWTDRIAGLVRHRPHLDRVFITDPDLQGEWEDLTGRPITVLPWGSDTLAFPPAHRPRPVDLLRLGRQPSAWDDDEATAAEAARHGLTFHGRPPWSSDPRENQQSVRRELSGAKLVLAFSNLVSPAAYTHPTRDYLTGRWTDALAAGCLVAGVAPHTAQTLLWPGATVEISPTSPADAWATLREAALSWSPEKAQERQRHARAALDWRHRLAALVREMGWDMPAALATALSSQLSSD